MEPTVAKPAAFAELAGVADFAAISDMMDRANQYSLESGGALQWTLIERVRGQVQAHIEAREMYVVRSSGNIIGAVALSERDGAWGERDDGSALYIHKLMKDPASGEVSRALGSGLLRFCAGEAERRGKTVLRCDVKVDLARLVEYYKRHGFQVVGKTVYESTGLQAYLMEAAVSDLLNG